MRPLRTAIFCLTLALPILGTGACKKKPEEKSGATASAGTPQDMSPARATSPRGATARRPGERPAARRAARPRETTQEAEPPEGVLSEVKGTVEIRRAGQQAFAKASQNAKVFADDSVRVGADGEAVVALWDNSSIELPPESALTLNGSDDIQAPSPSVTVLAGAVRFEVTPREEGQGPFTVYTPTSVVNVQGTTLAVGVALSGAARVAVEEGKVELVPVAAVTAKPVALPAGKVVVVAPHARPTPPAPYKPDTWDDWLEAEDAKAAKRAEAIAEAHAAQVAALAADAQKLEAAEQKAAEQGVALEQKAAEAERQKKLALYKQIQPKLAENLELVALANTQRQFVTARLAAHAYLLALLRARAEAGLYKLPPPRKKKLRMIYERALRREALRERRARRLRRLRRRRLRRLRRAFLLHDARGRALAPKLAVPVPAFYRQLKLRPRLRRRALRLRGYPRPLYRRPRYRGKVRPLKGFALARLRHQRNWYRNKMWRVRRAARRVRQASRRAAWRRAVVQRRRRRWAMRPRIRMRRLWRPGMAVLRPAMGLRHPGMLRPVMGLRRPGMAIRVDMGPGWRRGMRVGRGPLGMAIRRERRLRRHLRRMHRMRRMRRHLRQTMGHGMAPGMR